MHGGASRAVPAPVPVRAGAGVPFLDNASMPVWQASGAGADQVPNSSVHGAIFGGGWHTSRQVKINVIRIAVSVYGDLLSSAASAPEQACSFSPHSCDSCIESTCHISYGVALLDAQCCTSFPVPPQKKSAQIRHRITESRKQLRGGGTGGALPAVRLKFQAWPALEKRGGHRGQPAAAKRGMFRWLEDSIQRRRFFGGIRVALMGAGTARKFVLFFRIY